MEPVLQKKATAVWQWFQFLKTQIPQHKPVLLLNLDETCIRFWYDARKGLQQKRTKNTAQQECVRHASRGQMRKAITLVAVICDDETIQPMIPQIILMNENVISKKSTKGWTNICGTGAEVWRKKSAWINNDIFAAIIRRIGSVIRRVTPDHQVILLMDAHVCHYSDKALKQVSREGIWPIIIPASTTSSLQPLDTHVFARFKLFLRQKFHEQMLKNSNRDMSTTEVLDALVLTIKGVLQSHKWRQVFQQNGFGNKSHTRPHLLAKMNLDDSFEIQNDMPSLMQFKQCFPNNKTIPIDLLLKNVVNGNPKRKREVETSDHKACSEVEPWSKRLRPRLHRFTSALAATIKIAGQSSSSSCHTATRRRKIEEKMMTTSGEPLPSLKRFPPSGRRSRFFDDVQKEK